MNKKNEPCRNFQRGSCQYGERCRFLHVNPQQQQKTNSFGFGTQANSLPHQKKSNSFSPHQQSNPFGFGAQNNYSSQSKGGAKTFENTWSRFGPTKSGTSTTPTSADHKCTDTEECKRLIASDFQNERPIWNLTCYSHCKGACDIIADVSYEELRAAAYDEAKRGVNLQSIVERERNLLNSKLEEFKNLVNKPRLSSQTLFPGSNPPHPSVSSFSQLGTSQNVNNPPLSSFGQLGTAQNVNPPLLSFGQLGTSQNVNHPPPLSSFGQLGTAKNGNPPSLSSFSQLGASTRPSSTPLNNVFGQSTQTTPGNPGSFGNPVSPPPPAQSYGSSFPSNNQTGFGSSNLFSSTLAQSPALSNNNNNNVGPTAVFPSKFNSIGDGQATSNVRIEESFSGDASIWVKDKWNPGEIPEEAPPDAFIR